MIIQAETSNKPIGKADRDQEKNSFRLIDYVLSYRRRYRHEVIQHSEHQSLS